MKLLRTLFRYLVGWFVSLFSKQTKTELTPSNNTPWSPEDHEVYNTIKPSHSFNNRKRTRGRFIQVIDMGYTSHVIRKAA